MSAFRLVASSCATQSRVAPKVIGNSLCSTAFMNVWISALSLLPLVARGTIAVQPRAYIKARRCDRRNVFHACLRQLNLSMQEPCVERALGGASRHAELWTPLAMNSDTRQLILLQAELDSLNREIDSPRSALGARPLL